MRRKFLRQNRDIARVNSNQSLRIRTLESECGRLLSENLTLNGRILELEKELDESKSATRIADHALEIKAKMEAQLMEWGAMLQGLGVEPATKRQATTSPGGRTIARPRKSGGRSPTARQRPRDSRSAEELAAIHRNQLPPIHENKTHPRRTMRYVDAPDRLRDFARLANLSDSHVELLAVCTEAADTSDSPDLGPPPTSRFVEDEPVKIDSPTRSTGVLEPSPKIKGEALQLPRPDALAQPKLEPKKRPLSVTETTSIEDPKPAKLADAPPRPLVKAGSKRKFGDENDGNQFCKSLAEKDKTHGTTPSDEPLAVKDSKVRRNAKDVSKHAEDMEATTMRPRKPLANKSTNDDLVSPKKLTKSATTGDLKKTLTEADRAVAPLKKKRLVPIKLAIPPPPAPSTTKASQEPATPSADPGIVSPDTPETKPKDGNAEPGDTPPPVDISVHGETSRPSRRVRAAVSYAEPSLRDKMRRPTKELFDAVSGEGKFIRSSSAHLLGPLSASQVKADDEGSSALSSKRPQSAESAMANEAARRPTVVSPLLQREPSKEQARPDLPESVVMERRRRPSSKQSQLFEQEEEDEIVKEGKKRHKDDPYEFQSTSPPLEPPREVASKGRITKGMRRSMAAGAGQSSSEGPDSSKPSRKRASMAAPKKACMLDSPLDYESSYEASGGEATNVEPSSSLGDRVSRRRSMML